MASTACFLHHHALTTPTRSSSSSSQRQVPSFKPTQLVCRAQKQEVHGDDTNAVSRRLALTVLIGAASLGSKVSPADAAYGEAGTLLSFSFSSTSVKLAHAFSKGFYFRVILTIVLTIFLVVTLNNCPLNTIEVFRSFNTGRRR